MSRRVALVTPTVAIDGGVARHVRDSADALVAAGRDVTVITGGRPDTELAWPTVLVPGLEAGEHAPPHVVGAVSDALRAGDFAVAHLHNYDEPGVRAAAEPSLRVVVSAHGWSGCGPNTLYIGRGRPCGRPNGPGCLVSITVAGCSHSRNIPKAWRTVRTAGRRLEALRTAEVAVAYSRAMEAHLRRNGITPTLVAMPVEPHAPAVDVAPADRDRVLFVGRLSSVKGADVLLRACTHAGLPVEIVGRGPHEERLRALARDLGTRVTFSGWLDGAALDAAYARARVVAMPHRWPEPFGLVGIEALQRARPVVASRSGGTGDWLDDGVTGLAVRPGDVDALAAALRRLWDDPGTAARMGAEGRVRVRRRFSFDAHVRSLDAAYEAAAR